MSLLITNKFKMSAIERGETFIRDVKKLRYTDEYRAIHTHREHTWCTMRTRVYGGWTLTFLARGILARRHSPIQLGGIRARIRVNEKIRYAASCPLNEAYISSIIYFETPVDLVPICADSENFYCYLTSTVITIEKQMEQRMIIFFKRAELSE